VSSTSLPHLLGCSVGLRRETSDLEHQNQYVVGLALCTLGNIASQEMARDLFQEIEGLLSTANPYIQKKAALCTMRIIRKVPDLQEHFVNKTKPLLQDRKNHGVLLCGLTLVTDLCQHDPDLIPLYVPYVPVLVQHLKKLTSSGYAPEHDVTGITDPFLQVKILHLLRILGKNNPEVSEQINDILTQVRPRPPRLDRGCVIYSGRCAGCYEYGLVEKRREFHSLRSRAHHLRHRVGQRPHHSRHKHPGQIPDEQGQQRPLCGVEHASQGGIHGSEGSAAT